MVTYKNHPVTLIAAADGYATIKTKDERVRAVPVKELKSSTGLHGLASAISKARRKAALVEKNT